MSVAGWIRAVKEVRWVTVEADEFQEYKRGPVPLREERQIVEVPRSTWSRLVVALEVDLPLAAGAGPCGTRTVRASGRRWAVRWSVFNLLRPLRAYYATYEPPMRFGAKPGPRGRKAA